MPPLGVRFLPSPQTGIHIGTSCPTKAHGATFLLIFVGRSIYCSFEYRHSGRYCMTILFGGVPERPKGTDCKSVGVAFEGSNPSPTTIDALHEDVLRPQDQKQAANTVVCRLVDRMRDREPLPHLYFISTIFLVSTKSGVSRR